ncbi:ferritin-like domain-containing protein [Litchfieldella xinjiangensis]|uniref:ferritin-like domain-containing protein n=1 Tax=Litchfieldella xinjiangensis TaxID=1166948 RepID=UPI0005BBBB76|nr:ferritin-like domain-containing protein [Halomonas xinjiangensis]
MATETEKHLTDWLRDAHAMEQQAEKMLEGQASRLEHYPELRARIEQHIQETRGQSKKLEECMSQMGVDLSTLKDMGAKLTAFGQAMSGMLVSDEVVKGSMASYSFEHFEIASYKALIQAAEAAGKPEVARVCQEILKEEEAMAKWLSDHLDDTTRKFLERAESGQLTAKS